MVVQNQSSKEAITSKKNGESGPESSNTVSEGAMGGSPERSGDPSAPRSVIRGACSRGLMGEVGIHWLRFSIEDGLQDQVIQYLNAYFGENTPSDRGHFGYDKSIHWEPHVTLMDDNTPERLESNHGGRFCVDISGGSLDILNAEDLEAFCGGWRVYRAKCKRVDVYFDDYSRAITPSEIYEENRHDLAPSERSVVRCKAIKQIRGSGTNGLNHDEVTFGRRGENGNGRYVRIYDKELESDGENPAIRYEAEFTDQKAIDAFVALSGCQFDLERFGMVIGGLVGGSVYFVERTGDPNIARLSPRAWWATVLDFLGSIKLRGEKRDTSVQRSAGWILKCAKTFAMVSAALGAQAFNDWFGGVIADGQASMTTKQVCAVQAYRSRGVGLHS